MAILRYAINVTLDGCCHHEAGLPPDDESMRFWTDQVAGADALLYGRVTFEMMRGAWKRPDDGRWPDWMDAGDTAFAEVIDAAPKHVVSRTLTDVDWGARLLGGDLRHDIRQLKTLSDGYLSVGGVALPTALAAMGLIDEYVFVVHPVLAGHGPTLLAGLPDRIPLVAVERTPFASGAVATRYVPA